LTPWSRLERSHRHRPSVFRQVIEWLVLPTIGHISLRDLTTQHINSLYVQLLTQGKPARPTEAKKHGQIKPPRPLAAATVQKTHVALSRALSHAVTLDWLDHNPAVKAVRPRPTPKTGPSAPRTLKTSNACSRKRKELTRIALLPASGIVGWHDHQAEANWEARRLHRYSSRDTVGLTRLSADARWSNEGLFAFLEGLRRLARHDPSKTHIPGIEISLS
jgi:hypothetical protein